MTTSQDIAVTYTGTDDPFKDRIYRSGLAFTSGQTRLVPATLAQRFLRHSDVFKQGVAGEVKAAKQAKTERDDTKQVLDQQQQQQDARRELDEARFALLDSIDSMDREALSTFAEVHYQQKIHHKLGLEKARDMVRGFVDQYGMPA